MKIDSEKLKTEIDRLQSLTMDKHGNFNSDYSQGEYDVLCALELFIDSAEKESVNRNLDEACIGSFKENKDELLSFYDYHAGYVDGADWQKKCTINDTCEWMENNLCCYIGAQDFTIEHKRLEQDFRKAVEGKE